MGARVAWGIGLVTALAAAPTFAQAPDPTPAPAPAANTVDAVTFEGLEFAAPADLLALMKTRPGRVFSAALLEEDIHRLGLAGFLVVGQPTFDQGRLRLKIEERPIIRGLDVSGASEVATADVRQAAGLRVGDPLVADVLLERVRDAVRDLYRERGFQFAHVTVAARPDPRGVRVQLTVDEGPKTAVEAIEITGAHGIPVDDLLAEMQTDVSAWYGSKYLDPGTLAADTARLQRYYRERGWLDARVTLAPLAFSPDGEQVTIRLTVEEGRRYRVHDVRIDGAHKIPVGELYALLEQPLDVPLDARWVFGDPPQRRGDLQRLRAHYEERGYFNVQIVPTQRIPDPTAATIDIIYQITEGDPTRIGRVDITGNRVTREKVVRRFLPFAPGEKLRTEVLQMGFLRLYQSQYFRDVRIDHRPSVTPGYTDILIEVEEAERNGNLQFGGAYNPSLGVQGTFQLEIQNFDIGAWSWPWNLFRPPYFRGGGQTLKLGIAAGGQASNYSITFQEPRFLDSLFSLSLSLSASSRSTIDFDERRRGGSIGFGRNLTDWLGASLSWQGQFVQIRNVDQFAPPELQSLATLGLRPLSKFRGGLNFDWTERDVGRRAYQGLEVDVNAEIAHKAIGSHWNYWSVGVHPSLHWTLFGAESKWRHVVSLRVGVDYAEPLDHDPDVPYFERYFAGGFGTIRGFDVQDVGPRVNDRPVGGKILAVGSLEYSIPLYRDTLGGSQHLDIIRMVFFYDWGTVLSNWEDYDTNQWRMSVGFGFRLNPLGFPVPFALDFGWAIKRQDYDDRELISVTFDVRF